MRALASDLQNICEGEVDVGELEENSHATATGFSWHESTAMNEHFVDFPVMDSSENESCSSA